MEEEVDDVAEFVNTREAHYLYQCKRDDLLRIAGRLGITITASTKEAIQKEIMDYLRDYEENPNTDDSDGRPKHGAVDMQFRMMEFELEKLKIETERAREERQFQERKLQVESELKLKELELRKLELESGGSNRGRSVEVDLRGGQLPEYIESEAEHFFLQFEKIAEMRGWDQADWAFLVQSKIYGQG
ncbi:hypothetical protein Pcinc_006734 [Petrolisthes cinctipes]|uniref:Uncharacterized protein n=2 Tax=Petrolisthes cinctipes TaxID=88211 RepID=A0AAE1GGI3_PETCI|nr:hypothetical protein Pcinc_006734 [Petrolisthes cinctipes]